MSKFRNEKTGELTAHGRSYGDGFVEGYLNAALALLDHIQHQETLKEKNLDTELNRIYCELRKLYSDYSEAAHGK